MKSFVIFFNNGVQYRYSSGSGLHLSDRNINYRNLQGHRRSQGAQGDWPSQESEIGRAPKTELN